MVACELPVSRNIGAGIIFPHMNLVSAVSDVFLSPPLAHAGYIDLSKRRVDTEEIAKCESRWNKSKQVQSIMTRVAKSGMSDDSSAAVRSIVLSSLFFPLNSSFSLFHTSLVCLLLCLQSCSCTRSLAFENRYLPRTVNRPLIDIHQEVTWPMYKTYGHAYDGFRLYMSYVVQTFV